MPNLRDNIFPETSLHSVPWSHDTITLKRLCAVCPVYMKRLPLKRLCIVCQVYLTKLFWNVCMPCDRFPWQCFLKNVSEQCVRFTCHYCTETSVCSVVDLHDTITLKRLCYVWHIYVTIFPKKCLCAVSQVNVTQLHWNVSVPCARSTWQYYSNNVSVTCATFTSHICHKTFLYRVPGLRDNVSLKCLCSVCQANVAQLPKISVCRVRDLRNNITHKPSTNRMLGLRDTIALKRMCPVCQVCVAQLPWNDCLPCARLT